MSIPEELRRDWKTTCKRKTRRKTGQILTDIVLLALLRLVAQTDLKSVDITGEVTEDGQVEESQLQ